MYRNHVAVTEQQVCKVSSSFAELVDLNNIHSIYSFASAVKLFLEDYISKFMYDNLKIKGMIELDFS